MVDLVIEGGTAIPISGKSPWIEDARIVVHDGKIVSVGVKQGDAPAATKTLEASGCLITPGFVNAHTHLGMGLYRGIADDVPFERWLCDYIFPIEQRWASAEVVYLASLLGCAEMIRSGTTFFNDMYYFEEQTARAAALAGLRGNLGITFIQDHLDTGKGAEEMMFELVEKLAPYPGMSPAMAPHALYSLSEAALVGIIEIGMRNDFHINMHVSETQKEVDDCLRKTGLTPVAYLDRLGLWKNRVTIAHAVVLTDSDIETLGRNRVGISHNPESNLKLGNQIAPVVELRNSGAWVGLGTDSVVSNNNLNLLEEASTCAKLQSLKYGPGKLTAPEVLSMLTFEGGRAVGRPEGAGQLAAGCEADLVIMDAAAPHLQPVYHPISQMIYSAQAADIRDVVAGGKLVMESRRILTFDEQALLREVGDWGRRIASEGLPR